MLDVAGFGDAVAADVESDGDDDTTDDVLVENEVVEVVNDDNDTVEVVVRGLLVSETLDDLDVKLLAGSETNLARFSVFIALILSNIPSSEVCEVGVRVNTELGEDLFSHFTLSFMSFTSLFSSLFTDNTVISLMSLSTPMSETLQFDFSTFSTFTTTSLSSFMYFELFSDFSPDFTSFTCNTLFSIDIFTPLLVIFSFGMGLYAPFSFPSSTCTVVDLYTTSFSIE